MDKDRDLEPEDVPENTAEEPQDEAQDAAAGEAAEKVLVDEVAVLQQELEEAKAKEAEYLDGWQRARAELSNARKRFQRDREQSYANARADVLTSLLPAIDDFERAADTLPENLTNLGWVKGVLLIQRKLQTLLDQSGVVSIQAVGEEFDPLRHQAITHEASSTVPEGHVIAEVQKGYRMGERVLRPTMVRVSAGPPEGEAEDKTETEVEKEPAN